MVLDGDIVDSVESAYVMFYVQNAHLKNNICTAGYTNSINSSSLNRGSDDRTSCSSNYICKTVEKNKSSSI